NTSGCPTGTGNSPRPCAGASQGGCPSGNAITDSWGFRFAKGMAVEKVTDVATTMIRVDAALLTMGGSEIALAAYGTARTTIEGYQQGGVVGAGLAYVNRANPIYAVGMAGVGLYNAVDEGDPEKIGRAALPVAEAIIGIVAAGRLARSSGPGPVRAGEAGRFADLDARAIIGDELTPHHMPQAARLFTSRADGGALVLPDTLHAQTRTFRGRGAAVVREEAQLGFRDTLARDIRDVRRIAGPGFDAGVRQLLQYYYTNFPELMKR
ncbi:MAG TPA: hypothetical protein PK156_28950, partial [Polyangium sp.]|nr:hypothetical protein [Polyangium sp.]